MNLKEKQDAIDALSKLISQDINDMVQQVVEHRLDLFAQEIKKNLADAEKKNRS